MRYSRQEIFIGSRNQKKLQKSIVTIVGCGGTGTAAAEYLARTGVNLRLIDRDIVETSNLHRQLYREEDVGRPKAEALKERLEDINSEIRIEGVDDDLNPSNIDKLLSGSSIVIDGTDNMETRFLVNDFCLKNRVPFMYGAAIKSEGLFTLIVPKETACIRCFIPDASGRDTCETAGVLGHVVGLIGVISAAEAMKYIIGKETLRGQLLHINLYRNLFEIIELKKNKNCPACKGSYEFLEKPAKQVTELCGGTYQFLFEKEIDVSGISEKLEKNRDFKVVRNRNVSQIIHKKYVISLFKKRMIVQNAYSPREVKVLASKIIGN